MVQMLCKEMRFTMKPNRVCEVSYCDLFVERRAILFDLFKLRLYGIA